MYREFLSAYGSGTGKKNGLSLSTLALQKIKYAFIIQVGVKIVHPYRIRAIKVGYVFCRDPFTEICFKAVNSHIQKDFQLVLESFAGCRIGEVHNSHAGLPGIPLPDLAVGTLDQVSVFHTFIKKIRFLSNIRIDPDTDIQSLGLNTL